MSFIHNIKHRIQTKIYHACLNIKEEREQTERKLKFSAIDRNSNKIWLGKVSLFLGVQYIHIDDGTCFGDGVYLRWVRERHSFSL